MVVAGQGGFKRTEVDKGWWWWWWRRRVGGWGRREEGGFVVKLFRSSERLLPKRIVSFAPRDELSHASWCSRLTLTLFLSILLWEEKQRVRPREASTIENPWESISRRGYYTRSGIKFVVSQVDLWKWYFLQRLGNDTWYHVLRLGRLVFVISKISSNCTKFDLYVYAHTHTHTHICIII